MQTKGAGSKIFNCFLFFLSEREGKFSYFTATMFKGGE